MKWIIGRLKEPSTHAGIGLVIAAAAAFFPQYAQYILGLAAVFGFNAAALPEQPKQPNQ